MMQKTYKFRTRVSKRGTVTLPVASNLFNKEVMLIVLPLNEQTETFGEERNQSDFFEERTGVESFESGLKRAVTGDELMNGMKKRIHKMFENASAVSSGS